MTLKQRRRHGELMQQLHDRKADPYIHVPKDYTFGEDKTEDEKYHQALESLKTVVEALHELESAARDV